MNIKLYKIYMYPKSPSFTLIYIYSHISKYVIVYDGNFLQWQNFQGRADVSCDTFQQISIVPSSEATATWNDIVLVCIKVSRIPLSHQLRHGILLMLQESCKPTSGVLKHVVPTGDKGLPASTSQPDFWTINNIYFYGTIKPTKTAELFGLVNYEIVY